MTILDHRILIPKSPEKIWEFLSDVAQNPAWQVDCKSISILTTKHTGAGVRWRYTTTAGHAYVVETTAWYDGLGYEYTFVDGTPFHESKGRIRLQEIAEGTVVQWTLTYEITGVLGGVRNAVGLKRQFESAMVDSLKNLWKVLQKVMPEDKPREVKSLMRDAPDYESRTQYRPRHPSVKQDSDAPAAQLESSLNIVEPPIAADDTRPRAPVKVDEASEPTEPIVVISSPVDDPDTGTIEPVVYPIPVEKTPEAREFVPRIEEKRTDLEVESPARRATQEIQPVVIEPVPVPEVPQVVLPEEKAEPTPAAASAESTAAPVSDTVKMATSEMSVFELFGLPRPSQTQQMNPVVIAEPAVEAPSLPVTVPSAAPAPYRVGLRLMLRRKRVALRRPV